MEFYVQVKNTFFKKEETNRQKYSSSSSTGRKMKES